MTSQVRGVSNPDRSDTTHYTLIPSFKHIPEVDTTKRPWYWEKQIIGILRLEFPEIHKLFTLGHWP